MKYIFRYILGLSLALAMFSCQKDPMAEITDGEWNKERNILSISLENQFGPAEIIRDEFDKEVIVSVNKKGLDLTAVKINELVLSYGASSTVVGGATLNFDNEQNKTELIVTAAGGESITWTIFLKPYDMFYVGKWNISSQKINIKQEFGSEWDESIDTKFPEAAKEFDNSIEITYVGFEDGRTNGTITNLAGADEKYGTYSIESVDITSKIRHLIPAGQSNWEMDLTTNTLYITKDGVTSEAKVAKDAAGAKFTFELKYKPEDPFWDYGDHDNYLSWSNRFDVILAKTK